MAHDDRTREGPLDNMHEWRRCNWLTHPLFKSLIDHPDPMQIAKILLRNQWEGEASSLWGLRAALAHIDHVGMRQELSLAFEAERIPASTMELWPHDHLRSRFIKEEVSRGSKDDGFLVCLARHWPWLWQEEAQQQGAGEAHPVARLFRSSREDVLDELYASIDSEDWLSWQSPASDKMVALVMRKASAAGLASLLSHDPAILTWRRHRDGRNLLHEACSKLRPDLAQVLLSHGLPAAQKNDVGETPAVVALGSVVEKIAPRQTSVLRQNQMLERLDDILHLLGASGGLDDGDVQMMEDLRLDRFERMRGVVERALLSSSATEVFLPGEVRRL